MRHLLAVLLFVAVPVSQARAETELRAEVDYDRIDSKGQVTLTISVSGEDEVGRPTLPALTDFILQATGSRQNMVISGGQIENTTSYTYVLIPRKTGSLVISPVSLETPAGMLTTQPITVTVTQTTNAEPRSPAASGRAGRHQASEPFFVEAEVSKDTVYLGEQLNYTFRYYRSVSVSETNNYSPPQTSGFIAVDLPPQRKLTRILGGETYSVVEVVTAMFPTRTGELVIGPARLRVVPDVLSNLMGRDPFSIFRGQGQRPLTEGEPRNLATSAFQVHVLPLPPVPAGRTFSGAVGECALATDISARSVAQGDPITITWKVSGVGRKDVVDAPVVAWPEGLEPYPPTTTLESSTRNDVVTETKVFSIALVARREGTLRIPAPELTYFNPKSGRYETASGRELKLEVTPPRAALAVASPTSTISASASSIRYIKGAPSDWRIGSEGLGATWFLVLQLLPPALVLAGWTWRRRMETPEARSRGARQREVRVARKRVNSVSASDGFAAAREISSAFRQYLVARFELPPGLLLDQEWQRALETKGCPDHDLLEIKGVLEWADKARFGGGLDKSVTPEAVLNLMSRLDRCAV